MSVQAVQALRASREYRHAQRFERICLTLVGMNTGLMLLNLADGLFFLSGLSILGILTCYWSALKWQEKQSRLEASA